MATKTLTDLAIKTLEKLGVLPDDQTPGPEETATVAGDLPAILEELAAREIVFVADSSAIPAAWFMPLANICAYECIEAFGIVGDEAATLKMRNDEAIMKLKVILRGRPTGEPQRTQYF